MQIFSRGFTGGMYGGRAGRDYITRDAARQPRPRARHGRRPERGELIVEVSAPLHVGDGLGFESPAERGGATVGFSVTEVRTLSSGTTFRQALVTPPRCRVGDGWRVVRTAEAALLERARASYAALPAGAARSGRRASTCACSARRARRSRQSSVADGETVTVRSEITLAPASKRALDERALREQLGRLGETPFVLGDARLRGSHRGLFLPVSELNHLRQQAVDELLQRRDWARAGDARRASRARSTRRLRALAQCARLAGSRSSASSGVRPRRVRCSRSTTRAAAAAAGATRSCFDPFPPPSRRRRVARVRALADELAAQGRGAAPSHADDRPPGRAPHASQKWLDLGLPLLSGHLGLVAELSRAGRDVIARLRGELLQPAHRGGAVPARRAAHRRSRWS